MYKDLPAFIIMAVHLQNSAMKTTCIQMKSLGHSQQWHSQLQALPLQQQIHLSAIPCIDENLFFSLLLPVFNEYSTHKIPEPL